MASVAQRSPPSREESVLLYVLSHTTPIHTSIQIRAQRRNQTEEKLKASAAQRSAPAKISRALGSRRTQSARMSLQGAVKPELEGRRVVWEVALAGRWPRNENCVQGRPKLWANFRALIGIFSQTVGPSLAIWANLVQFLLGAKRARQAGVR